MRGAWAGLGRQHLALLTYMLQLRDGLHHLWSPSASLSFSQLVVRTHLHLSSLFSEQQKPSNLGVTVYLAWEAFQREGGRQLATNNFVLQEKTNLDLLSDFRASVLSLRNK